MVNSGKKKYTKKTIMRGGAIEFSLIGFSIQTPNGIVPAPAPLQIAGNSVLYFIDGTQDTFFNTFRRVKFSKSSSTCYLVNQGTEIAPRLAPYQLIYRDGDVFQYAAYDFNRFRLVQQNSQMSDEDVAKLLNVSLKMIQTETNSHNGNPAYRKWELELYNAINNGLLTIDQIYNFLYTDGNNHKSFKAGKYVSHFWTIFHKKYEREFF
jgi:hypothetical protein